MERTVHYQVGWDIHTWRSGEETKAARLACGGLAEAGTGVILEDAEHTTCRGCAEDIAKNELYSRWLEGS